MRRSGRPTLPVASLRTVLVGSLVALGTPLPGTSSATPLGAQETGGEATLQHRLGRRLDVLTVEAVRSLVDSARILGLPDEPLVRKALEGASKGASPGAIVVAVRDLLGDLATAGRVLGEDVSPDALQLGAAALEAGAPPETLQRLRDQRELPAFPGALAGVLYLLSRGVGADSSVSIVTSMLEAGLGEAEFASLQRLVEQDRRGGVPSVEAATVRARALIRHGPRLRLGGEGGS
ncbi:MAG: hypothetical protein PVI57_17515 [Gemmatimonadota bacterium]|jgi:hypothetical protein